MARLPIDIMTAGNRNEMPAGQFNVDKVSADAFGGQIGNALSGFADAGMALAAKLNANQKQLQQFGYEDQFVKLQEQDNTDYEQRYRGISGSADGWWQGSRAATKTRMDEWLKTLPEQARAEYQVKVDRFIAGRTSQAFKDQFQQQDTNTKQTLTEEQRKAGLQVQQNPLTYEQFVQQQNDLIDKSTLPAAEKARLKAEARNSLAYTAELSRAQQNPSAYVASNMPAGLEGMKSLLRSKEGFRETPYYDVTAWRVGYGSDTITKADGAIVKVSPGMKVSREEAERDLDRRITTEFMPAAVAAIGQDAWAKLSPAAQAVMVSLSYNYGAGAWKGPGERAGGSTGPLNAVAVAAQSGDPQRIASAVRALAGHNSGANASRRNSEADMVLHGRGSGAPAPASAGALTPEQAASVQETARRQLAAQEQQRAAQYEADQTAKRNQLYIDLKEGTAPEATYRAARQSGLLSDFADIEKAERIIKERNKGEEDYGRGLALMQGGRVVANPYDKDHRDGVQAFYDRAVKGGADPAAAAAAVFDRTGIAPPSFATAMRGAMVSEDPARVAAGLTTASNMMRQNPNAFAGVDGGSDLEKNANEYRRLTEQLGLSSEQAVKRILADERDTTKLDPVRQEQLQQFKKQSLTQDQIDARLRSNFSSWNPLSSAPFSVRLPAGPQRTAMASIYSEFATEGYEKFRDPDKALAFADLRVQQQFGVQNGVLMRYPPAKAGLPKLAGTGGDGFGWINEQAAAVVKDRLGVNVDPSQVILVPVERDGVSTRAAFNGQPTTVTRDDSGRPEQRTTFQSVPYMITVMPKTPEQDMLVVNGAFFPDVDTYVSDKNKKIAADNAAAADAPMMYFDGAGLGVPVQPYQQKLLETPEQQQRREWAAKADELRASQARERDAREKFQAGTDRGVQQRQDTIARLTDRLKELDTADNPYTAQASRNRIDGEIMRLQGEIMQLQKRASDRKRQ